MHPVSAEIVPEIALPPEQVLVPISVVKLVVYVVRSARGLAWATAKKTGRSWNCGVGT